MARLSNRNTRGFVEGRNLTIEYAWTDGPNEWFSALAAELAGRHASFIVSGSVNATYAAKAVSGAHSAHPTPPPPRRFPPSRTRRYGRAIFQNREIAAFYTGMILALASLL